VAFDQLDGSLTERIAAIDEELLDLIARLEAVPARTAYGDSRPPVPWWREGVMPEADRARRAQCETGQRGDAGLVRPTMV
jgi:hypothetical protein